MYSHRGWSYSSAAPSAAQISARRRRRFRFRFRFPHLPRISPLPFAIVLVGAAAWYHFAFGGFALHGRVIDGVSGEPVAGARVWSARASVVTGPDGSFALERVKPPDGIG